MTQESGGAAPQDGFDYQDYAAAYYFLAYPLSHVRDPPETLYFENYDSDFAFITQSENGEYRDYFEVKKKSNDSVTWGWFKRNIADAFVTRAEIDADENTTSMFHTITNASFGGDLRRFLGDVEDFRTRSMDWPVFKEKHERTKLDALSNELDLDQSDRVFHRLFTGLCGHKHSHRELELELLEFIRNCSIGGAREATEKIMHEIHETNSGSISRRELEKKVGFDLDPMDSETGSDYELDELRDSVDDIIEEYQATEGDVAKTAKQRRDAERYTRALEEKRDLEGVNVHTSRIEQDFDKVIDAKRDESDGKMSISRELRALRERDKSSTSSDSK